MRRPTWRLVLVAAAALSAGCAYFAPTPALQSGAPKEQLTNDLPVPRGFALVRDRSWRHERSSYRRLLLTYRRDDYLAKERVSEFVQTHFPRHGWTVEFVYGLETPQLLLHKGGEECRLTITEDFGDAFTEFVIEVEPRVTPDGGLVAREPRASAPTTIPTAFPRASETDTTQSDIAPVATDSE